MRKRLLVLGKKAAAAFDRHRFGSRLGEVYRRGGSILGPVGSGTSQRLRPLAGRMRTRVAGDSARPNIGVDASLTAISVADAAKRTMIERLQESGLHDQVIRQAAFEAVMEASAAGADVTAAAVGAVAGAVDTARALGSSVHEKGSAAAEGAMNAATNLGEVAAERVRDAIVRRGSGLRLSI